MSGHTLHRIDAGSTDALPKIAAEAYTIKKGCSCGAARVSLAERSAAIRATAYPRINLSTPRPELISPLQNTRHVITSFS